MTLQQIFFDYPYDSPEFLRRFFSQAEGTDEERLYRAWQETDYWYYNRYQGDEYKQKFLKTLYWQIVSGMVIVRDLAICRNCHRADMPGVLYEGNKRLVLQAHHTTYKYQGKDHLHLNVLICLCRQCHDDVHDENFFKKYGHDPVPEDVIYRDWLAEDYKRF